VVNKDEYNVITSRNSSEWPEESSRMNFSETRNTRACLPILHLIFNLITNILKGTMTLAESASAPKTQNSSKSTKM